MSRVYVMLLVSLAVLCMTVGPTNAFNHIVGGSLGWNIPPNKNYYDDWAKPRVFGVEDKLLFPFRAPLHNVIEVTKEEFENCTQENAINMWPHGPLIVNFTQPGEHFYYSGIGTQCELGAKLHINVVPGKGSSGRVFIDSIAPAPAEHAKKSSAGPANAASGVGFVLVGLVSLVSSRFFFGGSKHD